MRKEGGIEGDSVDKEGSRHECAPKGPIRVPGFVDLGISASSQEEGHCSSGRTQEDVLEAQTPASSCMEATAQRQQKSFSFAPTTCQNLLYRIKTTGVLP